MNDSAGPRAADILARRLAGAGCRFAFGMPGGEVLGLIDALDRAGIRFVVARHETPAGFMAEGTWQMTGAPGVLVTTIGPGVTNAVTAVANAQQDCVPLIVLTGCVDPAEAHSYTHQVIDHGRLLRPLVKATLSATDGAIDVIADKAVAIALDQRPGPVHIDLPTALAGRPQPLGVSPRRAAIAPAAPAAGAALETARAWLAEAERPLVLAGLDVVNQGGAERVAAFCRHFRAPLLTTYKAKGILPEDEPLALGGAGLSPVADRILHAVVAAADLIVLAGYEPIEMRPGWRNRWDAARRRVVEFAAAPSHHYMHQATLSFVGDVAAGLEAMGAGLQPRATWTDGAPQAARRRLAESFGQNEAWGPAAIALAARAVCPRDTIASVDSGAHRIVLSQVWPCYAPRTLLQSTGLCTMGPALPLAIGAKLAAPDRPVVCFTGDGGLDMVMGELATLRDLGLAIPVVVFTDASLALIEMKQRAAGMRSVGVDLGRTDYPALARALGGIGVAVECRSELMAALKDALAAPTFTVISCLLPPRAYDGRI
jgi:acetolactate synthase-1/2/3 large subunit